MLQPAAASSVYFRNALCVISYHAPGYVQLLWTDAPPTEADLRAIYAHTLQAMKHHRTGRLLTDHCLRQPLPLTAQQWIAQEWIPQAVREAGYTHCAILENQTPLGRLAARAIGESISSPLQFRYFATAAEAVAWLLKA